MTLPGKKHTYRYWSDHGLFAADGILGADESQTNCIHHPLFPEQKTDVSRLKSESLLSPVMKNGQSLTRVSLEEISGYRKERMEQLPREHKRFENPHIYKVGVSESISILREKMIDEALRIPEQRP